MVSPSLESLDADELFMLGMKASGADDTAAAIALLKESLERDPAHARAHWALAAEYAALQMPDRAAPHFAQAVELLPDQPLVRFQYGLLALTSANLDLARDIWQPLASLPDGHPLRLFKDGLQSMVADRFDEALSSLRAVLAVPSLDPALAADVQMMIGRIEQVRPVAPEPPDAMPIQDDVSIESHLALSAYRSGGRGSTH